MNNFEDRIQVAVELFMKGYNCSQSVVAAFADLYGVDTDTALRMSAGFGGGVGRMRMICGAVSGMVFLAGLEKGSPDAGETSGNTGKSTGKSECYQLVQDLCEAFRKENGSIICAELLGMEKAGTGPVIGNFTPSPRNAEYYKSRPCAAKVESAARIFAEYLKKSV